MKAHLSVKRTVNLKTGEYQDKKRWVKLDEEQIRAFCMVAYMNDTKRCRKKEQAS